MSTVREILGSKGMDVISVMPEHTVKQAIEKLTLHKIGSVLVLDDHGAVAGILTERDILRIVHEHADRIGSAPVSEFMTTDVVCAVPEDEVDYVMGVMTKNRFRRMPVIDGDCLVGLVSIGDVVKAATKQTEYENRMLRDYIDGTYA